jgi:hypothetical protein
MAEKAVRIAFLISIQPTRFPAKRRPIYRRLVRRIAVVLGVGLALGGCSSDHSPKAGSSPTYKIPPRPVRDGETPLPYRVVSDGKIMFVVIGFRAGMSSVVGSHADWPAKGQFVRARVQVENGYPTFHTITLGKQVLLTTDGVTHQIDENGMRIERQPADFDLGAHDRLEFDLIYDIPKGAKATSLKLFGGPTDDLGIPQADSGVSASLNP